MMKIIIDLIQFLKFMVFIAETIKIKNKILDKDIIAYKPYQKIIIDKMEFNHLGKIRT